MPRSQTHKIFQYTKRVGDVEKLRKEIEGLFYFNRAAEVHVDRVESKDTDVKTEVHVRNADVDATVLNHIDVLVKVHSDEAPFPDTQPEIMVEKRF